MIDLSNISLKTLMNTMLSKVTNAIDKREGSIVYTVMAPIAFVIKQFYNDLEIIQRDSYVETAVGQALDYIVAERGLSRKPAISAVKRGIFNIKLQAGTKFVTIAGNSTLEYEVGDYIEQIDNYFSYKMICKTPGIIGNDYVGNVQAVNPINGLTYAYMDSIILEGSEIEDDESLRIRYRNSLLEKAFGGNIASYKEAILAIEGIGAVQVYPFWKGGGTVLCVILTTGYDIASETLIKECQFEICPPETGKENPSPYGYGVAPIGAMVTIGTATKLDINISAQIHLLPSAQQEATKTKILGLLQDYFLSARKTWGNRVHTYEILYNVYIIHSQILGIITSISEVLDCRELKLNGQTDNIICIESSEIQQLPFIGEVNFEFVQ